MSAKNFGASSSGYLDPTNRGFETVVFETGRPVLDKELNLHQDIAVGQAESVLRNAIPSGWISDDFVGSSDPTAAVFTFTGTSLLLQIPQNLIAHVNGWILTIANTNATGFNQLALPAASSSIGTHRTDVVILEAWRMLITAVPSPTGKSATGRIWRYGNVKTDPAGDLVLNYADDLEDVNVGSETTKRVQIQYRLRVVSGIDLLSFPYAMDDPTLVANTVLPAPDGTASAFPYVNQAASGDPGLWVAGDGNPANGLGTVDGYIYAIPLLGVFRRNSASFDRLLNQNGGVNTPTASDRPDGLNADVVVTRDIVDLRLGVSAVGWNYAELLEKNLTYLFDNSLRTEWILTALGGSTVGHSFLWNDQVGVSDANGGHPPSSGSDAGGNLIGQFDATRRRFSDRPVYEVLSVVIAAPGGGWANSTNTITFTSVAVYPYSNFNWAAFAPAGVVVHDLIGARFLGTGGQKTADVTNHVLTATGFGVIPVGNVVFALDALTGLGVTTESLHVDLLVCYPGGGMTKTATASFGGSSFVVNDPTLLPAAAPVSFAALSSPSIDATHREAHLEYTTVPLTLTMAAATDTTGTIASIASKVGNNVTLTGLMDRTAADVGKSITISGAASGGNNASCPITSVLSPTSVTYTNAAGVAPDANNGAIHWKVDGSTFRLPERASSVTAVLRNGVAIVGSLTLGSDGRTVTFNSSSDYTSPGDTLQVTYAALRPLPQNGEQISIWYEARAPQAGRDALLGASLTVIPRFISQHVYSLTAGSGSEDTGFPFPNAYVQTGGIYNTSLGPTFTGEHELNSRALLSISDFSATTGFLKLPTLVPYMPDPEAVILNRSASTDVDIEGRSYFKSVPAGYAPNAYAQDFSTEVKHKVILPMIVEAASTTPYAHKGQLLLVLLIRWAVFDQTNAVFFNADLTQNTTSASVFRIKGNLLSKRNV